jgi:hypothetical protein
MRFDQLLSRKSPSASRAMRIEQARGARLICREGTAWITMDGDGRDIVLAPGASFVVDSDGAVTVGALRPGQAVNVDVVRSVRAGECS